MNFHFVILSVSEGSRKQKRMYTRSFALLRMTLLLVTPDLQSGVTNKARKDSSFLILHSKNFFIHPMAPNTWYTQRIDETLRQLSQTKTQINRISLLRVLLFMAGFAGLILFYRSGTWAVVLTVCCTFLPFFILVKVHNRLYFRKEQLETQLKLNQDELKGLEGDYSAFEEGKEFIDAGHPYSYDLDLFGRKSLFQALGRTCTHIGKQTLAAWMQHHLTEKAAIETRQESIRDMSQRMEFREAFRVTGSINRSADSDEEEISRWSRTPSVLQHLWWVKLCLWAVPGINILLLALGLLHILSLNWFGMMFTVFVILSFALIQRVTLIQESYGKKLKTLNRYARLITLAKGETWQAPALRQLTDKLDIDGHSPAEASRNSRRNSTGLDLAQQPAPVCHLRGKHVLPALANRAHRTLEGTLRTIPHGLAGSRRRTGRALLARHLCL